MRVRVMLAILAAACDAPARPSIVGTSPPECSAPLSSGHDDVTSPPGPIGWLVTALPVQQADCAGPSLQYNATVSLSWRDRGQVHSEPIPMHVALQTQALAGTCRVRVTTQLVAVPAGRAGVLEPCEVVALSPTWASLRAIGISLDTLAVDGTQLDLAWPVRWSETLDAITECRGATPFTSSAFGLVVAAELSLPLADWRRMAAMTGPLLAIGVRLDGT